MIINYRIKNIIANHVKDALIEDNVKKDITSHLIPSKKKAFAKIIFREPGVLFGTHWVNEVFKTVDSKLKVKWKLKDGNTVRKNQVVCEITGSAKSILKGERVSLNFLQTLSSTCTIAKEFINKVKNKKITLLHTRKTIPGFRYAQNCACLEAGCESHRLSLSESILIKDNHLRIIDNLSDFIIKLRRYKKPIIVEAKTIKDVKFLSKLDIDRILLDNFNLTRLKQSLKIIKSIPVEISGNITLKNINHYARKGVSYISIGSLTKNIHALDMSLLIR